VSTPPRRVTLEGSAMAPLAGERDLGPADPGTRRSVTVVLRRRADAPAGPSMAAADSLDSRPRLSREELESAGAATTEDVDLVRGMAERSGLKVHDVDRVGRRIVLEGPVEAFQDAFGVKVSRREAGGEPYLGYAGEIQLPGDLDGVVTAVLGLSDRPAARPR
jgi:kumamolisin